MAEYWVSSKKHYCEVCRCWLSGHSQNVKRHETSARHISSLRNKMMESHKRKVEQRRKEEFEAQELKRLNSITLDNPDPSESETKVPLMSSMFAYVPLMEGPVDVEAEKRRIMNTINRSLAGIEQPEHTPLMKTSTKWTTTIDQEDGTLVYYNNFTGVRTKNRPKDFDGVLPSSSAHLTSNWVLKYDPNKRSRYYHNVDTGEIRWLDERPIAQAPPPQPSQSDQTLVTNIAPKTERTPDIQIKLKPEERPPDPPKIKVELNRSVKSEETNDNLESKSSKSVADAESKAAQAPVIGQWEVVNPKDSVFTHCVENMETFVMPEDPQNPPDPESAETVQPSKRRIGESDDPKQVYKPTYRKNSSESQEDEVQDEVVFVKRKIPKKN